MANLELTVNQTAAPSPFRPTREQPVPQIRQRGVYLADFLDIYGNPVIQAVARSGRVVSFVPWLPGLALSLLVGEMWSVLNIQDPPLPRLLD